IRLRDHLLRVVQRVRDRIGHLGPLQGLGEVRWVELLPPDGRLRGRKENADLDVGGGPGGRAGRHHSEDGAGQAHARRPPANAAGERSGLFDNGGPNSLHAEPTIAAAEAGKHVLCEKPLGRTADESHEVWRRVAATGVKHLCGFNYRFVPAVRLARELIDGGALGELRHFRGRYLQDWGDDPTLDTWRFDPDQAGSGALGDLATHVIDLA